MNTWNKPATIGVFRYLNADKGDIYRDIMKVFSEAREGYCLHLRPSDILAELDAKYHFSEEDLNTPLKQLCEWGNIDQHIDTAEVQTVEQFKRPRYLYSLTQAGAAAEKAILHFHDLMNGQGRLDTIALRDIKDHLSELAALTQDPRHVDISKIRHAFDALTGQFNQLTTEAHAFLQRLQRSIELQTMELQDFLAYKTMLIEYLENFLHQLIAATADISEILGQIPNERIIPLLEEMADQEWLDHFNSTTEHRENLRKQWHAKWFGLRSWFIRDDSQSSQALLLRTRTRAAIPALLEAVVSINDRRVTRTDRVSDLRALAYWFASVPSDEQAHRLWRSAFSLSSCRHLRIDGETLDERDASPIPTKTSWLDAPPLRLTPRLRKTGRHQRRGRPTSVTDLSAEKSRLRTLAKKQAEQIKIAREQVLSPTPIKLSELTILDHNAFQLLLDLLGQTLSKKRSVEQTVTTTSTDGSIRITMQPIRDAPKATIHTSWGALTGADHYITITDTTTTDPLVEATS